ncbi:hypothetical protein QEZ54_11610 [Catellatospora sp. KI3]|uniref:hypothetical protein n=1 Tax=Catellatospora sp. KI3 TaxID=3041620 RepID=UPI00248226E8|nr:hypothetical protein [Catellatospora sp. KI3]MDI1461621.1 hypothetical protein [Catellatospora sp. KI3]
MLTSHRSRRSNPSRSRTTDRLDYGLTVLSLPLERSLLESLARNRRPDMPQDVDCGIAVD